MLRRATTLILGCVLFVTLPGCHGELEGCFDVWPVVILNGFLPPCSIYI